MKIDDDDDDDTEPSALRFVCACSTCYPCSL